MARRTVSVVVLALALLLAFLGTTASADPLLDLFFDSLQPVNIIWL